jgi:hypothetical protein
LSFPRHGGNMMMNFEDLKMMPSSKGIKIADVDYSIWIGTRTL